MHACASAIGAFVEFHRSLIVASGLIKQGRAARGIDHTRRGAAFDAFKRRLQTDLLCRLRLTVLLRWLLFLL